MRVEVNSLGWNFKLKKKNALSAAVVSRDLDRTADANPRLVLQQVGWETIAIAAQVFEFRASFR